MAIPLPTTWPTEVRTLSMSSLPFSADVSVPLVSRPVVAGLDSVHPFGVRYGRSGARWAFDAVNGGRYDSQRQLYVRPNGTALFTVPSPDAVSDPCGDGSGDATACENFTYRGMTATAPDGKTDWQSDYDIDIVSDD